MKVKEIFERHPIKDDTIIMICKDLMVVTRGNWYHDNLLGLLDLEVESYTWLHDKDDTGLYINLK